MKTLLARLKSWFAPVAMSIVLFVMDIMRVEIAHGSQE